MRTMVGDQARYCIHIKGEKVGRGGKKEGLGEKAGGWRARVWWGHLATQRAAPLEQEVTRLWKASATYSGLVIKEKDLYPKIFHPHRDLVKVQQSYTAG